MSVVVRVVTRNGQAEDRLLTSALHVMYELAGWRLRTLEDTSIQARRIDGASVIATP